MPTNTGIKDVSDAKQEADPVWETIRSEVEREVEREPMLASFLHAIVLKHNGLEDALSFLLADKLSSTTLPSMLVRDVIDEALDDDTGIRAAVRADIEAVCDRDPASCSFYGPLLYSKGLHALESFRIAHWLWERDRRPLAWYLQNRISEVFGVDIHPAARIGRGVLIDHGTSVVIGETAVVEDNVSMLHEVTLGGTGKQIGDRHPKVRHGVLIGAGAKILGNVEIGTGAKIGAGSVVLDDVPPHCTAAGVPAKIVGKVDVDEPAFEMNHRLPHDHVSGSGI